MKKILAVLLVVLLSSTAALAAASLVPEAANNPVLSAIQKQGAKFYYLGNRMGLDGWFIVKDNQVQIAYATADNKGALIGAMFGQDGENITALQVSRLMQTNPEVAGILGSIQQEQAAIAQTGAPSPPPVSSTPKGLPSVSLSPGERLMHDLTNASSVIIGSPSSPEILMVMDPRCPHCQATWKALRDTIAKGAVHLRMIPIGTKDSDNERAAAILLGVTDPFNAWDKYVGGDFAPLAGTPSTAALDGIRANYALTDTWKIERTPYLVYRAKDGKVKVVQGEPDKISAVLSDLGV